MRQNENISININAVIFQYYTPKKSWKSVDGYGKKLDLQKVTKIRPEKSYIFMYTIGNFRDPVQFPETFSLLIAS